MLLGFKYNNPFYLQFSSLPEVLYFYVLSLTVCIKFNHVWSFMSFSFLWGWCVLFSTLLPHMYNKCVMYKKLWNSFATHSFVTYQINFYFFSVLHYSHGTCFHQLSSITSSSAPLQQVIPSACTYYNCSTIFQLHKFQISFCISLSHEALKYQELAFQCIDRGTSSEASYLPLPPPWRF